MLVRDFFRLIFGYVCLLVGAMIVSAMIVGAMNAEGVANMVDVKSENEKRPNQEIPLTLTLVCVSYVKAYPC
jgi:hypothetical protein